MKARAAAVTPFGSPQIPGAPAPSGPSGRGVGVLIGVAVFFAVGVLAGVALFASKLRHDREPAAVHAVEAHFRARGIEVRGFWRSCRAAGCTDAMYFYQGDALGFLIQRYARVTACGAEQVCNERLALTPFDGVREAARVREAFLTLPALPERP